MPKHGPNVWVVRRGRRFSIKEEGGESCLTPPIPQWLAIILARKLAKANRSELIVQDRQGRIRARDSHGSDPHPPKG